MKINFQMNTQLRRWQRLIRLVHMDGSRRVCLLQNVPCNYFLQIFPLIYLPKNGNCLIIWSLHPLWSNYLHRNYRESVNLYAETPSMTNGSFTFQIPSRITRQQSIEGLGITINFKINLHTSKLNCFSGNFPFAKTFSKDFLLTSYVIEKIC